MERDDPTLFVDRMLDPALEGVPGLHVLLVGVSRYAHLPGGDDEAPKTYGLTQLEAPSRTVRDFADLFLGMDADRSAHRGRDIPLKTMRVLASPSEVEAGLRGPGGVGTLSDCVAASFAEVCFALKAWQADASHDPRDTTFFYFAGHGLQRSRGDAVLLMADFLGGPTLLDRTLDVSNIYNGMGNPSFARMAQRQFYFIDACRTGLKAIRPLMNVQAGVVFDVEADGVDDRVAPIFHAAAIGRTAYAIPGGVSMFGGDLMHCLKGGAAECIALDGQPVWALTVDELVRALNRLVAATAIPADQGMRTFQVDNFKSGLGVTLRVYKEPPIVDCALSIEHIAARAVASISLRDASNRPVIDIAKVDANPYGCKVGAGLYRAAAEFFTPNGAPVSFVHDPEFVEVRPPTFAYSFLVRETGP